MSKDIVTMSEEAIQQAFKLQRDTKEYKNLELRLYIEGKGCDGFYYGVSFDAKKPDDISFKQSDTIELVCDPDSYQFCKGAHIEWVNDERGTGFLVDNPNQKKFRGKFYKRKAWQEYFASKSTQTESQ